MKREQMQDNKTRKQWYKSSHTHGTTRKWKSMKCSPVVDKIKVGDSCFTPHILEQIRKAYNKDHIDNPIHATDPDEVWKVLHERLSCEAEDCWLNQIRDTKLRKQIDRYVFAPDQPYEWKSEPNTWLSNYDIMNVLEQYETKYTHFNFIGPTPIDFDSRLNGGQKCVWNELCTFSLQDQMKKGYTKIGIIFNTDPHHKSGMHWISMFVDIPNQFVYFFDSQNGVMPTEVETLAHKIVAQGKELGMKFRVLRNKVVHQEGGTECGMYSLYFIITMLTEKRNGKPVSLRSRTRLFTHGKIPDKYVQQYRNVYFNV